MDEFSASTDEGGRTKFSKFQLIGLRNAFAANPYPDKDGYRRLSETLNISNKTLHSWFQNHRHREKIQGKLPPQEQADQGGEEDQLAYDEDHKTPYNPGHKKTKFSDHQRFYLQSFFSEKEYVDEDDISDMSAELMLSPKVIRIWFQHARERKKKNLPIQPLARGRGRGRGMVTSYGRGGLFSPAAARAQGRPQRSGGSLEVDEYNDEDSTMSSDDFSRKLCEDNEAGGTSSCSSSGGGGGGGAATATTAFTDFQEAFLQDFYAGIKEPDPDDLDYICEHVSATRQHVLEWFERKARASSQVVDAPKICSEILGEIVESLTSVSGSRAIPSGGQASSPGGQVSSPGDLTSSSQVSSDTSRLDEACFSCPYCGMTFTDEAELKEHEKLEAIEFEKEAMKFKEEAKTEDETYVTLGDDSPEDCPPEALDDYELIDDDDLEDDEDEEEEDFFSGEDSRDQFLAGGGDSLQHVKRPLNPFMIWLQEERKKLNGEAGVARISRSTGELIKDLSVVWKSMSEFDKMPYMEESRRLKELHKREHPNYIFNSRKGGFNASSKQGGGGAKYNRRANLVKSFICKRCEVGFTTKGNLFKHLRNFHPESPYDPRYYELGNEKSEERNLKRCQQCNMVFISKIGLGRHMLRVHNSEARRSDGGSEEGGWEGAAAMRPGGRREAAAAYSPRAYGLNYSEPVSSSSDGFSFGNPSDDDLGYEQRKVHVKTRFTQYQRRVLMESFQASIAMSKADAKNLYFSLADQLQLPAKIVRIWFQNARSARKRGKPLFSNF